MKYGCRQKSLPPPRSFWIHVHRVAGSYCPFQYIIMSLAQKSRRAGSINIRRGVEGCCAPAGSLLVCVGSDVRWQCRSLRVARAWYWVLKRFACAPHRRSRFTILLGTHRAPNSRSVHVEVGQPAGPPSPECVLNEHEGVSPVRKN